ncbi:MAG: hypothetical protein QM604_08985, partial [Microbacterium sp.]
ERLGTAVAMISHDLGLAASYADEVLVMYAGRAVEHAETGTLFGHVRMPYTKALLGAIPQLSARPHSLLAVIGGHPPDLARLPSGCAFRPRCPRATETCAARPELIEHEQGHWYACWHPVHGDAMERPSEGMPASGAVGDAHLLTSGPPAPAATGPLVPCEDLVPVRGERA